MLTNGEKLRLVRRARGLSQEEAAQQVGLAAVTLYLAEVGRPLTTPVRERLEQGLGIAFDDPALDLAASILRNELPQVLHERVSEFAAQCLE